MPLRPPALTASALVDHLRRFGGARALVAAGETLTYAELADRVADVAETHAAGRRLVVQTPGNDIDSVVAYLGALAADQVVLLCPEPQREALSATYDPAADHDLHPDLALLLSTSGSTGSPKLVRLSVDNLVSNARAIATRLGIRSDDVADLSLPLHYCYGLSVLHSHLLVGAAVRLTGASVLDEDFWDGAEQLTTIAGVPHTFDLLERSGFADRDLPRLRYLTQAGGRLAPDKVREWAARGREQGWDFVVMYGQTEATARLSTLPADRALDAASTIGLPLDGVEFSLAPIDHPDPSVGELVARGRGVMLGYATSPADLALGRTTHELRTGDLARQRPDGLWEVVGRRSRFAKVCGLRIDLDQVERTLARQGFVVAAADAGDRVVLGVATGARGVDPEVLHAAGVRACALAPSALELVTLPDLPRNERGKVDYPALLRAADGQYARPAPGSHVTAADVTALYARLLRRPDARPTDSFVSLGGDSLSYVEVSLRLEELIGDLPIDWPQRPAAALADVAGSPRRRGRRVETNVVVRALAIFTIVASHANLLTLLGGAHLLLAAIGFNFARFQLTDAPRRQRSRRILTATARVAVPSMLVIGVFSVVGLWAEGLTWRQVLLVNGLTSTTWTEPGWFFWFIEALVHTLLLLAVLLAVPRFHAWERAHPFGFAMALVGLGLATRYDLVGLPGDNIHRAHVVFWLVALGWAAARATTVRQRLLVSLVAVVTVAGALGDWQRDAYVALGLLALVWIPHVRLPDPVARLVGVLASASLWIYLTHWQVYPHVEDTVPWLATALSLAVGITCAAVADSGIPRVVARLRQR
jgi:acyl-CoA synthetase (AMP-forming)/AMP-acid ligase II